MGGSRQNSHRRQKLKRLHLRKWAFSAASSLSYLRQLPPRICSRRPRKCLANVYPALRPQQRYLCSRVLDGTACAFLNLHSGRINRFLHRVVYASRQSHHIGITMGSMNCKEYTTTADNASCANQQNTAPAGSYQPTYEIDMSEYTEAVTVCNTADLQENEMKSFEFTEDAKVLIVKQNGRLSAIGNKCTHYGAPLHTGVLGNGHVRCPWHGACFNIANGDIEDFPGLDSLPCYKVEIAPDGGVKVSAKRKDMERNKRLKDMVKRDASDERTFVVVGGGPAGGVCVETLRQEGFTGRIVMICREQYLPYDRIKVSKTMDSKIESIQFRNAEFYSEHSIETLMGITADKVDAAAKTVTCSNGETIKFDKIFIASGGYAFKPPIKGAELQRVVTIRDLADAHGIYELIRPDMNVVCLGSSFIALEAAAYLAKKVKQVTLIGRTQVPLLESFGEKIGERVLRLFTDNNVNMLMNCGIKEILGNSVGEVSAVQLLNDTTIPCDLLIMGTGVRFYTDFLQKSGVKINPNGSIDTDMHLMTNIPDIYVGGDIANAPIFPLGNERATIGHYQLAQYHGRIAAINMAGTVKELHAVPFFFTMLFGKGLRYSGYGKYTDVFIDGDLEAFKFAAFFLNERDEVIAVASCGRDPIVAQFAELQTQGKLLKRADLVDDAVAWTKQLKEISA